MKIESPQRVFFGIKGHVVCIDKTTGETIWKTQLFKYTDLSSVLVSGDTILAFGNGRIFGLNESDGSILWENALPGLGLGPFAIASAHVNSVPLAGVMPSNPPS